MRLVILTLIACALGAQTRDTNPFTSAKDVAEGKRLYSFYCVFCHGMDGVSGRGARLASTYRKHGSSDREMYRTIADGVPGTEMSGHWLGKPGRPDLRKFRVWETNAERSVPFSSF
jgi:cytochrome c553